MMSLTLGLSINGCICWPSQVGQHNAFNADRLQLLSLWGTLTWDHTCGSAAASSAKRLPGITMVLKTGVEALPVV
jgi:hypothetical protein